jgi:hypothetical protein
MECLLKTDRINVFDLWSYLPFFCVLRWAGTVHTIANLFGKRRAKKNEMSGQVKKVRWRKWSYGMTINSASAKMGKRKSTWLFRCSSTRSGLELLTLAVKLRASSVNCETIGAKKTVNLACKMKRLTSY